MKVSWFSLNTLIPEGIPLFSLASLFPRWHRKGHLNSLLPSQHRRNASLCLDDHHSFLLCIDTATFRQEVNGPVLSIMGAPTDLPLLISKRCDTFLLSFFEAVQRATRHEYTQDIKCWGRLAGHYSYLSLQEERLLSDTPTWNDLTSTVADLLLFFLVLCY